MGRFFSRISCVLIALLIMFNAPDISKADDQKATNSARDMNQVKDDNPNYEAQYIEAELPSAFIAQYPGYTGVGKLNTWMASDEEAVYLAKNKEGWLVLLCGAKHENEGWTIVESSPLPSGSSVVMVGDIWMLDLGHVQCSICRYHDDTWGIYMTGWYDLFIGPKWIGFRELLERQHYGKHSWGDLTTMDWISLEGNLTDALQYLDVSGYATPNQENVNDMTVVYETPNDNSAIIASLINGAPLFVLETNDDWTHVSIGREDGSTWKIDGWIRTKYLAFAEEVNADRFGMPDSILCARHGSMITIITPEGQKTVTGQYYDSKEFFVIGEGMTNDVDCWLVYSAYTEEIGFVEKEALVDIAN